MHDFLLGHSTATRKDAHGILFNSEINPVFDANGAMPTPQRTMDVTYIGKGYLYGQVGYVANTVFIGREWPVTQDQLAVLLRNVRCFYTWDSWTSTNVEAILCGAIPFFLRYEPWTEQDLDESELGYIPRLDTQHTNFDAEKFESDRKALRQRIDGLAASWDNRVREFTEKVERHFSQRTAWPQVMKRPKYTHKRTNMERLI
jgi:hypothetical protein